MRLWCVVATKTDGLCASRDFLSAELVACLDMSLLCADVEPTLVSKEPLFANVAACHLDRRSKAFHVQASAAESGVEIIDEISDIRSALHMQSDQQRSTTPVYPRPDNRAAVESSPSRNPTLTAHMTALSTTLMSDSTRACNVYNIMG